MVQSVIQIGFHLTGLVKENCKQSCSQKHQQNIHSYRVSITFDRCKITSVDCECGDRGIFWCQHVVALTLFRIRQPGEVDFRAPISESLVRMDRNQLQKFAQYLIASHPNEVLPSAQRIADELLLPESTINQISGAPDPTAGGGVGDATHWHLDEAQIRDQVRHHLANLACDETSQQLLAMCAKVREMFRVRDSNGPRMLTIMTEQFLNDPRLQMFRTRRTDMWQAYRDLWEELGQLWACVVLNPRANSEERAHWRRRLSVWSAAPLCPREDWEVEGEEEEDGTAEGDQGSVAAAVVPSTSVTTSSRSPSVFQLALTAAGLTWDDPKLHAILQGGSNHEHHHRSSSSTSAPVWEEAFPLACLRVHALRCNGFEREALRLAVAISRHLLNQQQQHNASVAMTAAASAPPLPLPHQTSTLPASRDLLPGGRLSGGYTSYSHPGDLCYLSGPPLAHTGPLQPPANPTLNPSPTWIIGAPSTTIAASLAGASSADKLTRAAAGLAMGSLGTSLPPPPPPPLLSTVSSHSYTCPSNTVGWIGLPGDPVGCLVECLLETSNRRAAAYSSARGAACPPFSATTAAATAPPVAVSSSSHGNGAPTLMGSISTSNPTLPAASSSSSTFSYRHVPIGGTDPPAASYLCLAVKVGVMGLCQQRRMPAGLHRQEKCVAQESRLLNLLSDLPTGTDSQLMRTLVDSVRRELASGWASGLGALVHTETYPMHATALLLFRKLLPHNEQLAYEVAFRAMRLPILEGVSDGAAAASVAGHTYTTNGGSSGQLGEDLSAPAPDPVQALLPPLSLPEQGSLRWAVMRTVEARQADLAVAMIQAARDSIQRLDLVMNVCDRHIHTAASLFKLSQDVYGKASGHVYLLCAAFHLALNVSVRTLHRVHWRRREMVTWAVSCAVEVGPTAVLHLVTGWTNYATPREAVHLVAPALLAPTALIVYPPASQEQIAGAVRQMALQAALKDPVHCSLPALTITEKDPAAFESGYKLVCEAAERGAIGPVQLFALARYLAHRACSQKAFTLALHAMRLFVLSSLQDSHPLSVDVLWACLLAHSLGRGALQEMLSHVVRNVHCPTLLADILHRCRMAPPPPHSPSPGPSPVHTQVPPTSTTGSGSPPDPTTSASPTKYLPLDRPPLKLLLDAAVEAFVTTTHVRLANISPRQYAEFLDFLGKARDTFHLIRPDGAVQFRGLVDSMRHTYRGKRKLLCLLRERFGGYP